MAEKKTHVITQPVTCPTVGKFTAGQEVSSDDVSKAEWSYLEQGGFLKSLDEIEKEADDADTKSKANTSKKSAGAKEKADAK